jgi:hypothetical protein
MCQETRGTQSGGPRLNSTVFYGLISSLRYKAVFYCLSIIVIRPSYSYILLVI